MQSMDPEERFERIERSLEFLAASQAQHDARMAEISGQIGQLAGQIGQLAGQVGQLGDQIGQLAGQVGQLGAQVGQLADLTLRIGGIVEEQARRMDRTDDRLNTLITVVERYFTNRKE